jgi:hypothetical protein
MRRTAMIMLLLCGCASENVRRAQAHPGASQWTTVSDAGAPVQVAVDYADIRRTAWLNRDSWNGPRPTWVRVTQGATQNVVRLVAECGTSEIAIGQGRASSRTSSTIVPVSGTVVQPPSQTGFVTTFPESWQRIALQAICDPKKA